MNRNVTTLVEVKTIQRKVYFYDSQKELLVFREQQSRYLFQEMVNYRSIHF